MAATRPRPGPDDPSFNGIAFIIRSYLAGAAIGALFTLAMLAADVGHLRTLILQDNSSVIAVLMLAAGMVLTFAGLYTGGAIMMMFRNAEP